MPAPRRALISVSDKSGLEGFAGELVTLGFEILSTGGTARYLLEHGIPVIDVSAYTGFPEIMDGRVKTLHPRVHGALLGRPDLPEDAEAIAAHGITPIELVVVNLYPFARTIARPDVTYADAIENIDIGGPSMLRSAAKNHAYVGVVTQPEQYAEVLAELRSGGLTLELRRRLAAAVFRLTAEYDRLIADWFATQTSNPAPAAELFPPTLTLELQRQQVLRHGENPHQQAALYAEPHAPAASLVRARQLNGKELSYNNLLDLDAAYCIARDFIAPAAVVIKHTNPCGLALGATLSQAFDKAYEGDPVSAFGSIIGLNRPLDLATAERMCEPGRFIEAIIAPGYEPAALQLLQTRPKWKANVRLLDLPEWNSGGDLGLDYRRVTGGLLVQNRDDLPDAEADWKVVTERRPTPEELRDLRFGWRACKHVKSNAIVFARDEMVIGVGAGQMSRLDSTEIAVRKAGERSVGAVIASDAFFPFRDGIDVAAKAGIKAAIQPGGSRNDAEVIAACNELGLAMIFTGRRHFKH